MKRLLFLLLTVLTASTAVAEPNYYGEEEKEIYIDKELTLLYMPGYWSNGELRTFYLFPQKEYEHYERVKSYRRIPIRGGYGSPRDLPAVKGGSIAKILEQAVKHAFPPEQLARIPQEDYLTLVFYFDKAGKVLMVEMDFNNKSHFTSIAPASYAKLMRYLKQHVTFIPETEPKGYYDQGVIDLEFNWEKLRKKWVGHNEASALRRKDNEELRKYLEEHQEELRETTERSLEEHRRRIRAREMQNQTTENNPRPE